LRCGDLEPGPRPLLHFLRQRSMYGRDLGNHARSRHAGDRQFGKLANQRTNPLHSKKDAILQAPSRGQVFRRNGGESPGLRQTCVNANSQT